MKFLPFIALLACVAACSPGTTSETSTDSTAQAAIEVADTIANFVLWPEVGVRESPGEKGKYLTTVYLGEEIEPTGDTASEVSGKNRVSYSKVKLADGKECWIRTDFIAVGYKPVVAYRNTGIFSRPDRVAVTGKRFDDYDVVAVRMVKYGWLEVRGIAAGEKWFTKGYINAADVAAATRCPRRYRSVKTCATPLSVRTSFTALQSYPPTATRTRSHS